MLPFTRLLFVLLALLLVPLLGCRSARQTGHADGLAGLSSADRALAEEQKVCPVSGQPLGSHGTPTKIVVDGQTWFVCCKDCIDELQDSPQVSSTGVIP
jgi:hypothetical protein